MDRSAPVHIETLERFRIWENHWRRNDYERDEGVYSGFRK